MVASDVILDVRGQLQDASGVRWSDAELVRYLDDSVREVTDLRPDVLLGSNDSVVSVGAISSTGSTVGLPGSMRLALVYLVCAIALSQDGDDRANLDRAVAYRGMGLERI